MAKYADLREKALLFLLCVWFIWFFNFTGRIMFAPILPLLEDEFLVAHAQASGIFVFSSAGTGIAVIVAGLYSGTLGYKKSIIVSLLLLSLASFLISSIHRFWLFYPFGFIFGFSLGLYLPAAIPLMTEYYSPKTWGRVLAIHDTGASIAVFAAPLIALFLLQFFAWRGIYVVFGVIFLVYTLVFSLASSEVKHSNRPKGLFPVLVKMRSLWLMAAIWFFATGANLGVYSVTPLYLAKELGLSVGYANTLLGVSRLGGIGVAIACGFLIDRFDVRRIIFLVLLIAGGLTILMGVASARYIGTILFLQACCVTAFFPAGLVAIAQAFSREMRSLASGIIFFMSVPGAGLIPYLLGVSGDLYSFRLGIIILGVCIALSSKLVFNLKELEYAGQETVSRDES